MPTIHDGPSSPHFRPLPFTGSTGASASAGLTDQMAAALDAAPSGSCVFWGIPFEIGESVILTDGPVSVEIAPTSARWLVFLHTSDLRPAQPGPGGIISPMRGEGQLAEHAADYVIRYADGSEARAAIRRRHQIGAFQPALGRELLRGRRAPQAPPAAAPATSRLRPVVGLEPDARRARGRRRRGSTGCGPGRIRIPRRPSPACASSRRSAWSSLSAISAGDVAELPAALAAAPQGRA